jgi:hypothetical protein
MFPYPIAKPQKCDIQTFYGPNSTSVEQVYSWTKPVGVSHVYMLLIGAGGGGSGASGGGSGAVTVWYGAAQNVPNNLLITPGSANLNTSTVIAYKGRTVSYLLYANSGTGATGGTAQTAGPFAASGFYKSTAGQNGASGNVTASSTTFLGGGGGSTSTISTSNYGYTSSGSNLEGYFLMQPIIVGVGAGSGTGTGGIGCGGGSSGLGGPGMVLIASW